MGTSGTELDLQFHMFNLEAGVIRLRDRNCAGWKIHPFMEDGRNCPSPLPLSLYYPFFPFLFTTEWAARMSIVWSRFSLAYSSPQLPLYRSCVRGAPAVGLVPSLRTELIYTLVTCCVIALFIRQNHLR